MTAGAAAAPASAVSVWAAPVVVVGHRGGRGAGWPAENTLAAFERARGLGADAVELDVRTCAGGEVVVVHDATLPGGAAGAERRVCEVLASDLRAAGVPTLGEVLSWCRSSGAAVNVELKHDVPDLVHLARRTARLAAESGADVLFSSFDPRLVTMLALLAPRTPRALLVHAGQPLWAEVAQRAARPPWVQWIHLERPQATPGAIAAYRRRGLRVGVWTVNDPDEAATFVRGGAGSIITDEAGRIAGAVR